MKPTYVQAVIEENDKLKLEIAELRQALTGRTVSCVFCHNTAKERDEAIRERDEMMDVMIALYGKLAAGLEGKARNDGTN